MPPMVGQRIFFGAVLIAALLGVVWGDIRLAAAPQPAFLGLNLSSGSLIPLIVGILATLGAWEALRLAASAGHRPLRAAVLAGVVAIHAAAGLLPAMTGRWIGQSVTLALVTLSFMTIGGAQVARRRPPGSFADMA